jgi:hypothetical protein
VNTVIPSQSHETYPVNCGVLVRRRHFIHDLMRVESARPSVHKLTESLRHNRRPRIDRRRNVLSPHVFVNREDDRDLPGCRRVQLPFTARTAPPNSAALNPSCSFAVRCQRRRTQSGLRDIDARTPGGGLCLRAADMERALGCGRYVATFHATARRQ